MKFLAFIILFLSSIVADSKPVTIGVMEYAPPFSSITNDGLNCYGFTVDISNAICNQLKIECSFKLILLSNQLQLLNDGTIDLAASVNPIIAESEGQYLFSLPYFPSDGRFITVSTGNINSVNDLKNKKIGVLKNTLYDVLIQQGNYTFDNIKQYQKFSDLIDGLATHEVDAIFLNNKVAEYLINNVAMNFKLVGDKIPIGQGYGFLALEKNKQLIKAINSGLLSIQADGTYIKIYNRYFSN
ncbi:transporter substrate-binding domain-containing protein [Legionella spiritensis]|uniref:Glutamine ABC transporter n=1 Tax=Legionella spiritensis TaxID=452 RepID=A0A0W0Z8S4_LEGSP|nr:transporter substrate-binding domain-containing protein [Legionella spiritensis]KTD65533.1 glutamine ABC transporter [Legionella spiritensis]SNV44634.1 glutamine ABC transporter [Legionella spiritensis]